MPQALQGEETMSLSASRSKPKFLVDENVKASVLQFLKTRGFSAQYVPRGSSDLHVASLSKSKRMILVTNDSDFADPEFSLPAKVFSVVCIRVRQDRGEEVLSAFSKLLEDKPYASDFEGKLILLTEDGFVFA